MGDSALKTIIITETDVKNLNLSGWTTIDSSKLIYCGNLNGTVYSVFGWLNLTQLCIDFNLMVDYIDQLEIVGWGDKSTHYEIWSDEEKIETKISSKNKYEVDYKELIRKGHNYYSIKLADPNELVIMNYDKVEIKNYTIFGEIPTDQLLQYFMMLNYYSAFGNEKLKIGVSGKVKFGVWGRCSVDFLVNKYSISRSLVKRIDIKFKGKKNQPFEVWVNNGTEFYKQYESENAIYTVPLLELMIKGFDDFSITSNYNFDTLSNDVIIEIEYFELISNNQGYGKHPCQNFDIYFPNTYAPDNGFPVLLTIHGGDWQSGNKLGMEYLKQDILINNIVNVNLEYRGLNDGSNCENMIKDIQSCIQFLFANFSQLINSSRIGLLGWSAGGHLALLYAFTNSADDTPIKIVISEAGPTDLVLEETHPWYNLFEILRGSQDAEAISPIYQVSRSSSALRTYLFYSKDIYDNTNTSGDGVVAYSQALQLKNKLIENKRTCELYELIKFEHNKFETYYTNNNQDFKTNLIAVIKNNL